MDDDDDYSDEEEDVNEAGNSENVSTSREKFQ